MPVLVGASNQLILANGSPSGLPKPSAPLSFFEGAMGINLAGGATVSYQQIYENQQWVGVAVNKLSRAIASLPLNVYRLLDESTGERERVFAHGLNTLLNSPMPMRGPMWLKQQLAWPTLLHGNGLMAVGVESPGAPPSKLIPLDWRFVTPHFTDNTLTEVEFWETRQSGEAMYLMPDSVLHMAWHAGRGDLGLSPLRHIADTVALEDAAQRYQAASFKNGVRHSSVYVLPPDVELTKEERAELRATIVAQQGGVDQAFQMALVSGGGDIKPLSHTAVEAALIEQRKLNREEIAAVYDIPPPMIGILDKATHSNITEQAKQMAGPVLAPWLGLIREAIQTQIIDRYQPWKDERLFVDFDLSQVLRGEPLAEVQAIQVGINTGVLTPNEGRQRLNLPPSDDPEANKLHMPTNNLTAMGDGSASPPADPSSDLTDVTPDTPDVVKAHLERVAYRVGRKGWDALDLERFRSELAQDSQDQQLADEWADRLLAAASERRDLRALTA
jgi:HK97 family phage portal protein